MNFARSAPCPPLLGQASDDEWQDSFPPTTPRKVVLGSSLEHPITPMPLSNVRFGVTNAKKRERSHSAGDLKRHVEVLRSQQDKLKAEQAAAVDDIDKFVKIQEDQEDQGGSSPALLQMLKDVSVKLANMNVEELRLHDLRADVEAIHHSQLEQQADAGLTRVLLRLSVVLRLMRDFFGEEDEDNGTQEVDSPSDYQPLGVLCTPRRVRIASSNRDENDQVLDGLLSRQLGFWMEEKLRTEAHLTLHPPSSPVRIMRADESSEGEGYSVGSRLQFIFDSGSSELEDDMLASVEDDSEEEEGLMCRICEDAFPEEHIDDHMEACSEVARCGFLVEDCNKRLVMLIKRLDEEVRVNEALLTDDLTLQVRFTLAMAREASTQENVEAAIRVVAECQEECDAEAAPSLRAALEEGGHVAQIKLGALVAGHEASSIAGANAIVPTIQDFRIIKRIAAGAYGRVFLARKKKSGDLYAIKVIRKSDMLRKNQMSHVKAERDILSSTNNPFLVKLFYAFQSTNDVFFVMEYLPGGDCFSLLQNLHYLDEEHTKAYVAELVLALEYLHSRGIVHRDLKPSNLLIDARGHLKLGDFGLSESGVLDTVPEVAHLDSTGEDSDRSFPARSPRFGSPTSPRFGPRRGAAVSPPLSPAKSERAIGPRRMMGPVLGTPDYLAPEVILGTASGPAIDWWAVGVLLYEFLTGCPPFADDTVEMIFSNILERRITWPEVPEEMSEEAFDIIDHFLCMAPRRRLGTSIEEVKAHPFFRPIEWDLVTQSDTQMPFVPRLGNREDTSYFVSAVPEDLHATSSTQPVPAGGRGGEEGEEGMQMSFCQPTPMRKSTASRTPSGFPATEPISIDGFAHTNVDALKDKSKSEPRRSRKSSDT